MSRSEAFIMPKWECPSCKKEQREDEYWLLDEDASVTCGFCDLEFEVVEVEHIMYVTLSTVATKPKVTEEVE